MSATGKLTVRLGILALAGALAACQPGMPNVEAPTTAHAFDAGISTQEPRETPGQCWASQMRPALFETVTEQRLVTPETRDAEGTLLTPATLQSVSHQRELRPRQQIWFRTPCPEEIGSADIFTASLQRALKARGFYGGAVTGQSDAATEEALRRYQAANGLDSPVLSLTAARALGLVATQ